MSANRNLSTDAPFSLREISELYHEPIWEKHRQKTSTPMEASGKSDGSDTSNKSSSSQMSNSGDLGEPEEPRTAIELLAEKASGQGEPIQLDPVDTGEARDFDGPNPNDLLIGQPLKTLYGISAFGNNFAVYRLKIDHKAVNVDNLLPRPEEESNNTYVTSHGRCPESWWAYDAATREGKLILDDVVGLSQDAFRAIVPGMFVPIPCARFPRQALTFSIAHHSSTTSEISSSLSSLPSEKSALVALSDSDLPRTISLFRQVPYLVAADELPLLSSDRGEVSFESAEHDPLDQMEVDDRSDDLDYQPESE